MKNRKYIIIPLLLMVFFTINSIYARNSKETIEVAVFTGPVGGLEPWLEVARNYEKLNPNIEVNIWGNPSIEDQLRPRIVRGDVPDTVFPRTLDLMTLANEGKIYQLDELLTEKAYGVEQNWEDVFKPGALNVGRLDDKQYFIPNAVNCVGWCYNKKMFDQYGWDVPQTWHELERLCAEIKNKGIVPIALAGNVPWYVRRSFTDLVVATGGVDAFTKASNLEPGTWNSPVFLKAAQRLRNLMDKGYIQPEAMGMNHTISQSEFVFSNTAMVWVNETLEREMRDVIPEDFEMRFFLTPTDEGPAKSAGAITLLWAVFEEGNNSQRGADFLKYVFSPENMINMYKKYNFVGPIDIPLEELGASDFLLSARNAVKEAGEMYSIDLVFKWYPTLDEEVANALTSMLNKEISPEEAVNRMEAEAERIRNNEDIIKYKL
ncbi:MAG TPA: ABC transporter substrate-binding protein [Aequorivita sp.]|nr:ABC transporter substrate-binding protein [Aequorivita sp.]